MDIQEIIYEWADLGYDRFRLDGNGTSVECRLWLEGDTISTIRAEASGIYEAVMEALEIARAEKENKKDANSKSNPFGTN